MKKQNERSKRKLTSKQASIIAAIICAIYIVVSFIFLISGDYSEKGSAELIITIFMMIVMAVMAYILLYAFVLKGVARAEEEAYEKLKEEIEENLKQNCFVEIELIIYEKNKQTEMLETILKHIDCKFYAKLLDSGEILIVCKDRHNNTVYEDLIKNYYNFNGMFKFKED